MAHCLDSNIFIEAHRRRFPLDIMPVFWETIKQQAARSMIVSIREVHRELLAGKDELSAWAKTQAGWFLDNSDAATINALDLVGKAVGTRTPSYKSVAKTKFMGGADPWVVAYCKAHRHTLVTEEAAAPDSLKTVKIPDIAKVLDVPVMNLNSMLRELGIIFK
jgi:hypothetical protein